MFFEFRTLWNVEEFLDEDDGSLKPLSSYSDGPFIQEPLARVLLKDVIFS